METIMNTLPRDIGGEIFSFIVPNSSQIEFRKHNYRCRDSYNKRCQKAYINGHLLENKDKIEHFTSSHNNNTSCPIFSYFPFVILTIIFALLIIILFRI